MNLRESFITIFGDNGQEIVSYFSPGRVNLIGEHIDYNGGMVLPCAINLGTYAEVRQRQDKSVRMMSLNFEALGIVSFDLETIAYDKAADWGNYPMGVFNELQNRGYDIKNGFDILFYGDLPNGAGLSSSASLEVLTATIVDETFKLGIDKSEIALICQKSENEFNGVNCGIMDQFSIARGAEDHAILLDCNTLKYELVPAALKDYRLVIINTNKKRGLVDSAYNERRSECERALDILKANVAEGSLNALCEMTPVEFLDYQHLLEDEKVYKRAYHAIVENNRTLEGKAALSRGDLIGFGEYMYGSHESLKHYFEVSCFELDTIVEASRDLKGVLGARMTGAGFGGCAIALVHQDDIQNYQETVGPIYTEKTGLVADFYIAKVSGGAGVKHENI